MARRLELELDHDSLEMTVADVGIAKGDSVTWPELVELRDHVDRILAQRERLENARKG